MKAVGRFAWLTAVAMIVGLTLALTAYKAHQNADRHARFLERNQRQKAAYELGREVNERMRMAFRARMPINTFQEAFGPLTEIKDVTDPKHAKMTHSLFHEKSQRLFYLRFEDGVLVGSKSHHGTGDVDTGVVLETPAFRVSESARNGVLLVGLTAWGFVLLGGVFVIRFRRSAALLLVVLSMVCGLCWLLAPNYTPTLKGISSNDSLATFGLMLICSLGFALVTCTQPLRKPCPRLEDLEPAHPAD